MVRKSSEKPKLNHRKGLWSPDEDQKLRDYVMNYGHHCWTTVPINAGLQRNGKSCRLRWINYLRPGLKRGAFSMQEEETILTLHGWLGNKWSQISQHLPGRTDNEIKNYWHSCLKKKIAKLENLEARLETHHANLNNSTESSSSYLNSFTQNPTFDQLEGSTADTNQLVPPVPQIRNLPKILFADWVGLDEFHGQDLGNSGDQTEVSNDGLWHGSDYQEIPVHGLSSNETLIGSSETRNYSSINEDIFHTQMKMDQIFNLNCLDFNIDDLIYINGVT